MFRREVRIGMARVVVFFAWVTLWFGRVVYCFVQVIPSRGVEDIVVAVRFGLREDRSQKVRGFESGRSEVEPVEMSEIRLMTHIRSKGPV
jgi:hypothetical protein